MAAWLKLAYRTKSIKIRLQYMPLCVGVKAFFLIYWRRVQIVRRSEAGCQKPDRKGGPLASDARDDGNPTGASCPPSRSEFCSDIRNALWGADIESRLIDLLIELEVCQFDRPLCEKCSIYRVDRQLDRIDMWQVQFALRLE